MSIWAAVIPAAASLVGGLFGSSSQKSSQESANATNLKIAQMNNEFNERMLDKQIGYNTEMYERQLQDNLAYSDPKFIRQRLQAAGYNPAVVGQNSLGTAVSSPSAQGINPPKATDVSVNPASFDTSFVGDAINNGVNAYLAYKNSEQNRSLQKEQENQLHIENQYKAQQLIADINEKIANTKNVQEKNVYQGILNQFLEQQQTSDLAFKNASTKKMEQDYKIGIQEEAIKALQVHQMPLQLNAQLSSIAADVALKYSQKELTKKQAMTELHKQINLTLEGVLTEQKSQGQQLENEFNRKTMKDRVDKVYQELWSIIYHSRDLGLTGTIINTMFDYSDDNPRNHE